MPFALDELDNFALAAAEMKLGHSITTPPGRRRLDRLSRARGHVPALSFGDVENGQVRPGRRHRARSSSSARPRRAAQDQHQTSTSGNA